MDDKLLEVLVFALFSFKFKVKLVKKQCIYNNKNTKSSSYES